MEKTSWILGSHISRKLDLGPDGGPEEYVRMSWELVGEGCDAEKWPVRCLHLPFPQP